MNWLFGTIVSLLVLIAVAEIANPMIKAYDASLPRTHFYSDDAWKDCGAMRLNAKARGFDAWTCHEPGSIGPG